MEMEQLMCILWKPLDNGKKIAVLREKDASLSKQQVKFFVQMYLHLLAREFIRTVEEISVDKKKFFATKMHLRECLRKRHFLCVLKQISFCLKIIVFSVHSQLKLMDSSEV